MDMLGNLLVGFETALSVQNLLFCFIGVGLGTAIGVLPGLGPNATISMLLPLTFALSPTTALIMLAGIYYGAQYGGSTTAILVNIPGESSSAVTVLDGYQLALSGRAGVALSIAAIGSFVGGTIATIVLALFAPLLTSFALKFASPEYFSLMVLGLVSSITLARYSILKAIPMVLLGMLFGTIGMDINSGIMRFTVGIPELFDGLSFVAIALGIFGFAEFIRNLETGEQHGAKVAAVHSLWPTRNDLSRSAMPILRGTMIGSVLGVLPGGGAILSSFASYAVEKKLSKTPEQFGKGAIEGLAGPETANNAGAQTSFVPMLALGLPSNPVMALMLGALIIQGIVPGPNTIAQNPTLFWGLIASMWIGNLMLLVLNLPLVGLWTKLLQVPQHILLPGIVAFSCIGVLSVDNEPSDLFVLTVFVLLGYGFSKLKCEPAPLLLGFILGPMLEEQLRRSLIISLGDPTIFLSRPISAALLAVAMVLILVSTLPHVARKREEVFDDE